MVIRVVEFSSKGYIKLKRFLHKNQHTQRKLLYFENWCNREVSKINALQEFRENRLPYQDSSNHLQTSSNLHEKGTVIVIFVQLVVDDPVLGHHCTVDAL